jgi:hypothetical protein
MWGAAFPVPPRNRHEAELWTQNRQLSRCWRTGCSQDVDKDGVGLCDNHIEEMREWGGPSSAPTVADGSYPSIF